MATVTKELFIAVLNPCDSVAAMVREAEAAKEVAKIVAWLRDSAAWHEKHDDGWSGFDKIRQGLVEAADAIEAGEYRNGA